MRNIDLKFLLFNRNSLIVDNKLISVLYLSLLTPIGEIHNPISTNNL